MQKTARPATSGVLVRSWLDVSNSFVFERLLFDAFSMKRIRGAASSVIHSRTALNRGTEDLPKE